MSTAPLVVGFTDLASDGFGRMMATTRAGWEQSYRRNLLLFSVVGLSMLVLAALSSGVPRLVLGVLGVVSLVLAVARVWSQRRFRRAEPGRLGDVAFVVDGRQVQIFTQPYMKVSVPVETFPLKAVTAKVVPAEGPTGAVPERLVITGPDDRTWQFFTGWLDTPADRIVARLNRR